MTAVTPHIPRAATLDHDDLARAVLRSLGQRLRQKNAWGVIPSLLFALLTFGVLPLLAWPLRFADFVRSEQLQLTHLAQWARLYHGAPEADALAMAAKRVRYSSLLGALGLTMVILLIVIISVFLLQRPPIRLWRVTYDYVNFQHSTDGDFYWIWSSFLAVGYLCHALQVRLHAWDMRRFVRSLNHLARREGLEPVQAPTMGIGIGPGWLLAGVILMFLGVLWALPLVLAGAFQRRYTTFTSPATRALIAQRMQLMLRVRRPDMDIQTPMLLRRRCVRELCRCPLPDSARFCPRCGAPAMLAQ